MGSKYFWSCIWSSTCDLTGFFWILSHVIYLKLTRVLYPFLLSKAEWWIPELLFLSLNNWGLNFLQNESSQFSQIYLSPEKLRQMFTFSFEWWNWPKYRIAKCQIVVFSITVSIIVQKLKFCKIEIEYTHITLLSAWDRSRDSTAKRTLSKHMWRSLVYLYWRLSDFWTTCASNGSLGPLHVLWQVSFGCWVTWSISCWQEYYKSVFFPKYEWWVAELILLTMTLKSNPHSTNDL